MLKIIHKTEFVYRLKVRRTLLSYLITVSPHIWLYRKAGRFDLQFPKLLPPKKRHYKWTQFFVVSPATATIPNVVGFATVVAQADVTAAGFANGSVSTEYSSTITVGLVISQDPVAGAVAFLGTSVFLVVSAGRAPTPGAPVGLTATANLPPIFEIPLQAGAPQVFSLALGQAQYRFTLRYRNIDQGGWVLDIADTNGNSLIDGIPLVTGADLLAQYAYLNFGGSLWVQTTSNPDAVPTFANLGEDALFYWVPAPLQ